MPVLCPRDWVQRITAIEKSFPKQLSLHTFQHTAPNMKLHLPKRLFTALLTAITLAAAPAALTLGSAAWGLSVSYEKSFSTTGGTGTVTFTSLDGDTNGDSGGGCN